MVHARLRLVSLATDGDGDLKISTDSLKTSIGHLKVLTVTMSGA